MYKIILAILTSFVQLAQPTEQANACEPGGCCAYKTDGTIVCQGSSPAECNASYLACDAGTCFGEGACLATGASFQRKCCTG